MKKAFISAAGILLLAGFTACNKDQPMDENSREKTSELVYENPVMKEYVSPYALDDHLVSITRIGCRSVDGKELIGQVSERGVEPESLELSMIRKFVFNNNVCDIYSIPLKNDCDRLIAFDYNGHMLFAYAGIQPFSDTLDQFSMRTLNGELCYEMKISQSNFIGEIQLNHNKMLDEFRNEVFNLQKENNSLLLKASDSDYCRQQENWSACFECTMNDCGSKWWCVAAVAVHPIEFIVAFAGSCIGANPDALA